MLLFVGGCETTETQHEIEQGDLLGSWTSSEGGSIRFLADHEASTSGFSTTDAAGEESCGDGGVGRWSFYFETDDSGEIVMTSEGSLISVRLSEGTERECHVDLSVIDAGRSLCIADLDQVCSSDLRFTRQ